MRVSEDRWLGCCERCGRGFITLPKDMVDHYGIRSPYREGQGTARPGECGGRVILTEAGRAALKERE
jgi:hypothetical protein